MLFLVATLAAGATVYQLLAAYCAWRFAARKRYPEADVGLVSLLKPVARRTPVIDAALATHRNQTYPHVELLEADGPQPDREGNPKIVRLQTLQPGGEIFVVSDADIRLEPDSIARIVVPFADPQTGCVTCLYRARPGKTFASLLDALWISADFPGQVLTAERLQGMRFALGAVMAVRRSDLEAVGGWEALRPYLADDYQLGARIAQLGKRVVLSDLVVETAHGSPSWREVWTRHLRWSRTIRVSRPAGHFGLIWTQATVWGLGLLTVGAPPIWAAVPLLARLLSAVITARAVGARWVFLRFPLVLVADLVSFAAWLASFASSTVEWGGRRYRQSGEGRIVSRVDRGT